MRKAVRRSVHCVVIRDPGRGGGVVNSLCVMGHSLCPQAFLYLTRPQGFPYLTVRHQGSFSPIHVRHQCSSHSRCIIRDYHSTPSTSSRSDKPLSVHNWGLPLSTSRFLCIIRNNSSLTVRHQGPAGVSAARVHALALPRAESGAQAGGQAPVEGGLTPLSRHDPDGGLLQHRREVLERCRRYGGETGSRETLRSIVISY